MKNSYEDVQYVAEHLICENYAMGATAIWGTHHLENGEMICQESLSRSVLAYVLEGCICVSFAHYSEYPVSAGQILLVPANENFCGKALGDCRVITCALCGEMALCNKFSLKMLAPYAESLPPTDAPATLPATPILKDGLELAYRVLSTKLLCIHYQRIKREEFLLMLRGFYSKEMLAAFFKPILGNTYNFKEKVIHESADVGTVKELATRLNMSASSFNRRFQEAFGEPAGHWLIQKKKENIMRDILVGGHTVAELAEKHGFTTNYFIRFCKDHFGQTPAELMKTQEKQLRIENEELKI